MLCHIHRTHNLPNTDFFLSQHQLSRALPWSLHTLYYSTYLPRALPPTDSASDRTPASPSLSRANGLYNGPHRPLPARLLLRLFTKMAGQWVSNPVCRHASLSLSYRHISLRPANHLLAAMTHEALLCSACDCRDYKGIHLSSEFVCKNNRIVL
jgi:hypothetical protein